MSRTRTIFTALALTALTFGAVACGSDSEGDSTTTTTEATTDTTAAGSVESAETVKFDKSIQQELADQGCHPGAVDGVFGPSTDAAIMEFQKAAGLKADGQFGPETAAALTKAVEAGKPLCETPATTTTTAANATTTTAATPNGAACTATALLTGLPAEGETISSYVCSGGYAAGSLSDGTKFILQAEKGGWYAPSQDPCGSASAGLPPVILTDGCPA